MMRISSRLAVATGLVLAAPLITSCSTPEPETLTVTTAGGVYLAAVCPVNAAWDRADVELERLRLAVGRGGDDVATADFARAMREVAATSADAEARLGDPERSWPKATMASITAVRTSLVSDVTQAKRVAQLDSSAAVGYAWEGGSESADAATAARTALKLPEDPQAACAQWAEQERAEQNGTEQEREDSDG